MRPRGLVSGWDVIPVREDVHRLPDFVGTKLAVVLALRHGFVVGADAYTTIELDLPLLDPRLAEDSCQPEDVCGPNIVQHIIPRCDTHENGRQDGRHTIDGQPDVPAPAHMDRLRSELVASAWPEIDDAPPAACSRFQSMQDYAPNISDASCTKRCVQPQSNQLCTVVHPSCRSLTEAFLPGFAAPSEGRIPEVEYNPYIHGSRLPA